MEPKGPADVFLLAENRLLREALIRILTTKSNIRVAGAGSYSAATRAKMIAARPSIVLLDSIGLVLSGNRFVASLQSEILGLKVVMVDMELDPTMFLRAVREGVVGYVLKDASAMEVVSTINAVSAGEAVCPPTLSMAMFECVARHYKSSHEPSRVLSRRERELLHLLRDGLSNKEIATRLNLAEQTVKNHVHRILRKVGAPDRMAIVASANLGMLSDARSADFSSGNVVLQKAVSAAQTLKNT